MNIAHNVSLASDVYYRIGGIAKTVITVSSVNEILEAVKYCQENKLSPIRILGLGCNILLKDGEVDGVLLHLVANNDGFSVDDDRVKVYAGNTVDQLIEFSFAHNLSGLAWAGGLPSSVGGAVRGNAGCFGSEIRDVLDSVDYIDITDPDLKNKTFSNSECQFDYRESYFKHHQNLLIISATFQLRHGDDAEMKRQHEICQKNIDYRATHHPLEYPSCGSVFKNIAYKENVEKVLSVWPDVRELSEKKWYGKIAMAYVIGRLGFSGYTIGGAKLSEKHNNYIVNVNHAKAADVKQIISDIREKFEQTFHFMPELEVEIAK